MHARDDQQIEGVGKRRRHHQGVPRHQQDECRHSKGDQWIRDASADRPARQPERESEKEERRQRCQIATQKMRRVPCCEETHLQRKQQAGCDADRDERAGKGISFESANRPHRQRRDGCEGDESARKRSEGQVLRAQSQAVADRVATAQRPSVGADQGWERRERHDRRADEQPRRPERSQARAVACAECIEHDRRGENSGEHDRLRTCCSCNQNRRERADLASNGCGADRVSADEQRARRDRVEQNLRHDQARVQKHRSRDGQYGGQERIPISHQSAPDDEHRHGGQRDDECLQQLQGGVAMRHAPQ